MALNSLFRALTQQDTGMPGSSQTPTGFTLPQAMPESPVLPALQPAPNPYPNDDAVRAAQNAYLSILNKPQQPVPAPKTVNPAYRTEDLLKALGLGVGSLFFKGPDQPAFLANALAGLTQGKEKKAASETAQNQQNYQIQSQQANQNRANELASAEGALNAANADYTRNYQAVYNAERLQQKAEADKSLALSRVQTAFNNARSEEQKKAVAKQWRLLDPQSAPDDLAIHTAWLQDSGAQRDRIIDNWRNDVKAVTDHNYGIVPPEALSTLMARKKAYEAELKAYGLDDISLFEPPTQANEEKKLAEAKLAEMNAKLPKIQAESNNAEAAERAKIANIWSQINYRKEALQYMAANAATGQFNSQTSRFNADTARLNYEQRKLENELGGEYGKKIQAIKADIERMRAKQQASKNYIERQKLEAAIKGQQAAQSYWEKEQAKVPKAPSGETANAGQTERTGNQPTYEGMSLDEYTKQAIAAIRAGADAKKVKERYQQVTGKKANF